MDLLPHAIQRRRSSRASPRPTDVGPPPPALLARQLDLGMALAALTRKTVSFAGHLLVDAEVAPDLLLSHVVDGVLVAGRRAGGEHVSALSREVVGPMETWWGGLLWPQVCGR